MRIIRLALAIAMVGVGCVAEPVESDGSAARDEDESVAETEEGLSTYYLQTVKFPKDCGNHYWEHGQIGIRNRTNLTRLIKATWWTELGGASSYTYKVAPGAAIHRKIYPGLGSNLYKVNLYQFHPGDFFDIWRDYDVCDGPG